MRGKELLPLFQFLEKIKKIETPFKYKFLYAPETITKEDLYIEGELDLDFIQTPFVLPDGLTVIGNLSLLNSNISNLPNRLRVTDSIFLVGTHIKKFPKDLRVGKTIYISPDKREYFKKTFPEFAKQIR